MPTIIEQLYWDAVNLHSTSFQHDLYYRKQAEELVHLEEQLQKNLSPSQLALFQKLNDMQGTLFTFESADSFANGFRLGALIMQDILAAKQP